MLYATKDVGEKKVDVAFRRAKEVSHDVNLVLNDKKIVTIEDAISTFQDVDVVVNCADIPRPGLAYMMSDAALKVSNPIIYGGSAGSDFLVGPLYIPKKTLSYREMLPESSPKIDLISRMRENYENNTSLINPINTAVASILTMELIKYVT